MADNTLRVDDNTAEMCKIKALANIRVIRDLEMILTAQSVESVIADAKLQLIELLPYAVILLDLIGIINGNGIKFILFNGSTNILNGISNNI